MSTSRLLCKGKKWVSKNCLYKKETCKCQIFLVQRISGSCRPGEEESNFYGTKVNLFLGSQLFLKCALDDMVFQIPNSFGTENYYIHNNETLKFSWKQVPQWIWQKLYFCHFPKIKFFLLWVFRNLVLLACLELQSENLQMITYVKFFFVKMKNAYDLNLFVTIKSAYIKVFL